MNIVAAPQNVSTNVLQFVFFLRKRLGEGRENRLQLRCGIASQSSTAPANGVGKANRSITGEGGGEARVGVGNNV